jgi:hypothetical protein
MTMASVAAIAGPLIGLGTSIYSSRQARDTGNNAAALADPFAGERGRYGQTLSDMWAQLTSMDPSTIMKDPQFQFLKEQGLGALNSNMAAKGMYGSGNRGTEAAKFATGLSTQFLNILGMLGQLSGGTTGNMGAAGQYYGQGNMSGVNYTNQGIGGLLGQLGRVNWGGPQGATNGNSGTPYTQGQFDYPGIE